MQEKTIPDLLWQAIDAYHNGCGVYIDITLHVDDMDMAVETCRFASNVHPERWTWGKSCTDGSTKALLQYGARNLYPMVWIFVPMDAVLRWMGECGQGGEQ